MGWSPHSTGSTTCDLWGRCAAGPECPAHSKAQTQQSSVSVAAHSICSRQLLCFVSRQRSTPCCMQWVQQHPVAPACAWHWLPASATGAQAARACAHGYRHQLLSGRMCASQLLCALLTGQLSSSSASTTTVSGPNTDLPCSRKSLTLLKLPPA
jgi:hypothetical protein